MGRLTTTRPPWPHQGQNSSYNDAHGTSMAKKVVTSERPHSTRNTTAFTYWRHGESASPNQYIFTHNSTISAMYYSDSVTDVARRLANALAKPTPDTLFARFGAQTMDTIRQLADIFATTVAPTPTSTPHPRRTRATIHLPIFQ